MVVSSVFLLVVLLSSYYIEETHVNNLGQYIKLYVFVYRFSLCFQGNTRRIIIYTQFSCSPISWGVCTFSFYIYPLLIFLLSCNSDISAIAIFSFIFAPTFLYERRTFFHNFAFTDNTLFPNRFHRKTECIQVVFLNLPHQQFFFIQLQQSPLHAIQNMFKCYHNYISQGGVFTLYHRIYVEHKRLEEEILSLQEKLSHYPEGKFYCTRDGNHYKWYNSKGSSQTYIPKSNQHLAQQLAEKKYL